MIEHPLFRARWTALVLPQMGVLLLSAGGHRSLKGAPFADLALLLDGVASVDDLISALRDRHDAASLYFCLMQMESAGYLMEGPAESPASVLVWTESGARLARTPAREMLDIEKSHAADGSAQSERGVVLLEEQDTTGTLGGDLPQTPSPARDALDERFTSLLEQVRPALSESLVPASSFVRMIDIAQRLPRGLSPHWGFESRLDHRNLGADISLSIWPDTEGASLLAGDEPSCLDDLCKVSPVWQGLRTLARHWQTSDHAKHPPISRVWLELDTAAVGGDAAFLRVIHRPNLFIGTHQRTTSNEVVRLAGILCRFFGVHRDKLAVLRWFVDALPPGAKLRWMGWMLTREADDALRLCIGAVAPETLRPWLSRILPGEVDNLMPWIDAITPLCSGIVLQFSLGSLGVDPDIGVECFMRRGLHEPAEWLPLIGLLENVGIPVLARWQAITNYVGVLSFPLEKRLNGDRLELNAVRNISHIKCELAQGRIEQAKVYLNFAQPRVHLGQIVRQSLHNSEAIMISASPGSYP